MPKMNPELKAKWVAALRDPNRKQIKGKLRHGDGMCCLGVLCDVVDPARWEFAQCGYRCSYRGELALPPGSVSDVVGLDASGEQLTINGHTRSPQVHNDSLGATFLQIADAIEEQW